jgi:hypothetical protein
VRCGSRAVNVQPSTDWKWTLAPTSGERFRSKIATSSF